MKIPSNFGIFLMEALVVSSIMFSVLFFLLFCILVARRLVEKRLGERREKLERHARKEVVVWLNSSDNTQHTLEHIKDLPVQNQLAILEGVAMMVKGDLPMRLVSLFEQLGLENRLIDVLRNGRTDFRMAAARFLSLFPTEKSREELHRTIRSDHKLVAAVSANGLLQHASPQSALDIANRLLDRGIRPNGIGQLPFLVLCHRWPEVMLDLAALRTTLRDRTETLGFLIKHSGIAVIATIKHHREFGNSHWREDLLLISMGRPEPVFRMLVKEIERFENHDKSTANTVSKRFEAEGAT
jgi:hypothetical protein